MAGPGRPTKLLTDAVRKAVLKAVSEGCPFTVAAQAAGISPSTFRDWRQRGRRGESPFDVFLGDVKKAEAEGVRRRVARILKAGARHWQADAWYLERRHPDLFALDRKELVALKKELAELAARLEELKRASDRPPPSDEPPPPPGDGPGAEPAGPTP